MNRSELETKSRKQLLTLAEQAGVSTPRALAKAALVEALLAAPTPSAPAELPSSYGRTRLTLVEIEPHWVHAYWEITEEDRAKAAERCGASADHAAWVLRFYDVTGIRFTGTNAHDTFDVPVDLSSGNWYVNLWAGGKSYCAEMGLRVLDGVFTAVSRSSVVHVPVDAPSPRFETEWMKVDAASGRAEPVSEPPSPPAAPQPPSVEKTASGAVPVVASAGVVAETSACQPASPTVAASVPEPSALPTVSPPSIGAPAGTSDADLQYAQFLEPPGPNGNHNSQAAAEALASDPQATLPAGQTGAQESSPSSHSVGRFGMSSGAVGAEGSTPSIKLELNADIIIYGRAAPGQTVEVCGRLVKVNPDGTFNVRMTLPLADDNAARGG